MKTLFSALFLLLACGGRTELGEPTFALDDASASDSNVLDVRTNDAPVGDANLRDARADAMCTKVMTMIEVPVTAPWFDTGIDLTAGTTVAITASGTVLFGTDPGQMSGPNGQNGIHVLSTTVLPTTDAYTLIGKIGGSTAVDTGTPLTEALPGYGPGFVGASDKQIVPVSGRLFLGYNDERPDFSDNSGSFTVTIIYVSC